MQEEDLLQPIVRVVYDSKLRMRVPAKDIRLKDSIDGIECFEDPAEWGLDPMEFLVPPQA